jgi:integrase
MVHCKQCGSQKTWKDGVRNTDFGDIQRYICRDCGFRFSESDSAKSFNMTSGKGSSCQIGADPFAHGQVINLAAIEPLKEGPAGATENSLDAKGKIVQFSFWQSRQGFSNATIEGRVKLLKRMMRLGANFSNEDSIKEIIATQKWSVSRKVNAVDAYDSLLKMQGKTWTPPIYKRVRKLPFIPTESEIDQLIAGTSKRISTYLQLLKETGMRCGEASQLKWTDLDFESRAVRVTPEKGSNPRILPLSNKLIEMLNALKKDAVTVFGVSSELMRRNFSKQRKPLASKLKNPRIQQITFHTFRHWKATMEYYKTRDILHVKQILGHKSLDNTMKYTQLIGFKDDEFSARVAHSEDEACQLVETGFDFVCDFNGNKLFRKRK